MVKYLLNFRLNKNSDKTFVQYILTIYLRDCDDKFSDVSFIKMLLAFCINGDMKDRYKLYEYGVVKMLCDYVQNFFDATNWRRVYACDRKVLCICKKILIILNKYVCEFGDEIKSKIALNLEYKIKIENCDSRSDILDDLKYVINFCDVWSE